VVTDTGQPESIAIDDAALVRRAADGDAEAFRGLVELHQGRIVAFLRGLCGCPEQAMDLAQETFLSAFRHLKSFRHESRFSTWLHSIALNHARGAGRRRRPVPSLDAVAADGSRMLAEPVATVPDVSARLEHADLSCRLGEALDKLDARYRDVVVLADMHDASYEEIAATLEIPIGTVRSRLHRGRLELRSILVEP
jgi:RNA polymerase sigma-70 factor (ECF subfamily)